MTDPVRDAFRAQSEHSVVEPAKDTSAEYLLVYVTEAQRNPDIPRERDGRLVLTVRIDGVDMVRLYKLP